MKKMKTIGGVLFAALSSVSGVASAQVTGTTIVDFSNAALSAYYGFANLNTVVTTGTNAVFNENGIAVGTVQDPLSTTAVHLHRDTTTLGGSFGKSFLYGDDTSGIYIRSLDNTAFSINSLYFDAAISGNNPNSGVNDYWDIYGFSTAANPNLLSSNVVISGFAAPTDLNTGNPNAPAVAFATVANGYAGVLNLLSLDPNFANVASVWIHYNGYPHNPADYVDPNGTTGAYPFQLVVDNITLSAVPVPTAVWMFAAGLAGLCSFGRRKTV